MPSLAFLKASRALWRNREVYRYRKWQSKADNDKDGREKWFRLYQEAKNKRIGRDAEIKKAEKPRYAYRLDKDAIRAVAPNLSVSQAAEVADVLGPAFMKYGIDTPKRAAAAVAQFAHESAGFRTTTEFASGADYEGRKDLGNIHPGDGKRFKGRGYIQITGRNNYAAVSDAFGVDFLAQPVKLASPRYAALASAWWWKNAGCNQLADKGDFVALTRRINGGTTGLANRQAYHARAKKVADKLVPQRRKP